MARVDSMMNVYAADCCWRVSDAAMVGVCAQGTEHRCKNKNRPRGSVIDPSAVSTDPKETKQGDKGSNRQILGTGPLLA